MAREILNAVRLLLVCIQEGYFLQDGKAALNQFNLGKSPVLLTILKAAGGLDILGV